MNKTVFETEWFDVEQVDYEHLDSFRGKPYYRINSPDGVIVLAMTRVDEIVLVRQFRPALNKYTLELPAGSIDPGETLEQAVAREFHEETGYVCSELAYLGTGRIMMNRHNCRLSAFYGKGAEREPHFESQENTEVILVSPAEFRSLVISGQFEQYAGLALLVLTEWKLGKLF
jgi:ADP-ribose pyrophosphatase